MTNVQWDDSSSGVDAQDRSLVVASGLAGFTGTEVAGASLLKS
jgi:hypothetical protein